MQSSPAASSLPEKASRPMVEIKWISSSKYWKLLKGMAEAASPSHYLQREMTAVDEVHWLWVTMRNKKHILITHSVYEGREFWTGYAKSSSADNIVFQFQQTKDGFTSIIAPRSRRSLGQQPVDSFVQKLQATLRGEDPSQRLQTTSRGEKAKQGVQGTLRTIIAKTKLLVKPKQTSETESKPKPKSPTIERPSQAEAVDTEETVGINHYDSWSQVADKLKHIDSIASFNKKMKAVFNSKVFTKEADNYYKCWFDHKDSCLLLGIERTDKFDSNIFSKDFKLPERPRHDNTFYNLYLHYQDGNKYRIGAKIRVSTNGQFAELVHIQKTDSISGTDMGKLVCQIQDFFDIKNMILMDDANIVIRKDKQSSPKQKKDDKIPLRMTKAIASGESLYTGLGFEVYQCKDVHFKRTEYTFNQDPDSYAQSLDRLRKFKMTDVIKSITRKRARALKQLLGRIFGKRSYEDKTLSETTQAVIEHSKGDSSSSSSTHGPASVQQERQRDLLHYYQNCLDKPEQMPKSTKSVAKEFAADRLTIRHTQLFIRR